LISDSATPRLRACTVFAAEWRRRALGAVIYMHKILSAARSLSEIYLMDIFSFGGNA
jgi:hypothetical protein